MVFPTDMFVANALERLAPHNWALSVEAPERISSKTKQQGPVVVSLYNWLAAGRRR